MEVSFFSSPVRKVSPLLLSSQDWCPFRTYERFLCRFLLASFRLLYLAFVCLVCPPLATYDRLIRPLFCNFVLINAERRRLEYAPGCCRWVQSSRGASKLWLCCTPPRLAPAPAVAVAVALANHTLRSFCFLLWTTTRSRRSLHSLRAKYRVNSRAGASCRF